MILAFFLRLLLLLLWRAPSGGHDGVLHFASRYIAYQKKRNYCINIRRVFTNGRFSFFFSSAHPSFGRPLPFGNSPISHAPRSATEPCGICYEHGGIWKSHQQVHRRSRRGSAIARKFPHFPNPRTRASTRATLLRRSWPVWAASIIPGPGGDCDHPKFHCIPFARNVWRNVQPRNLCFVRFLI